MKDLAYLISFALVAMLLFACKDRERTVTNGSSENTAETPPASGSTENGSVDTGTSTTNDPVQGNDQKSDTLVFSIRRTACFGTCPTYDIYVYESGFATYEGKVHVDRIGLYQTRVGKATLETLLQEAESVDFFDMKAEYDSPVTDLPSTFITVARNGETKQVKGRVDPPAGFKKLAARAEELLLDLDWRSVKPQD